MTNNDATIRLCQEIIEHVNFQTVNKLNKEINRRIRLAWVAFG